MKKIIISLSIIGAVAAVASIATYAVFTAEDSVTGNTISSATVTLDVHNFSGNKPINTSNMLPGDWTPDGRAELYNTGSVPMNVYMYVENMQGAACDKTNLKVMTGWAGGDEQVHQLYNGPLSGLDGAGHRIETTVNPPFDQLDANWSQVIHQQAQLDSSAGNTYQNKSCTWDEIFVGETINP